MKMEFQNQGEKILNKINVLKLLSESKTFTVEGINLKKQLIDFATEGLTISKADRIVACINEHLSICPNDKGLQFVAEEITKVFKKEEQRVKLIFVAENCTETKAGQEVQNDINNILKLSNRDLSYKIAEGVTKYRESFPIINDLVMEARTSLQESKRVKSITVKKPISYVMEHNGVKYARFEDTLFTINEGVVSESPVAPQFFINVTNSVQNLAQYNEKNNNFSVMVGKDKYTVSENTIMKGKVEFSTNKFAQKYSNASNEIQESANVVLFIAENFADFYEFDQCVIGTNEFGDKVLCGKIQESCIVSVLAGRFPKQTTICESVKEANKISSSKLGIELRHSLKTALKEEKEAKETEEKRVSELNEKIAKLVSKSQVILEQIEALEEGEKKEKFVSLLGVVNAKIEEAKKELKGEKVDFVPVSERVIFEEEEKEEEPKEEEEKVEEPKEEEEKEKVEEASVNTKKEIKNIFGKSVDEIEVSDDDNFILQGDLAEIKKIAKEKGIEIEEVESWGIRIFRGTPIMNEAKKVKEEEEKEEPKKEEPKEEPKEEEEVEGEADDEAMEEGGHEEDEKKAKKESIKEAIRKRIAEKKALKEGKKTRKVSRKATRKSTKKVSLQERLEQIKDSKKTQKVSRKGVSERLVGKHFFDTRYNEPFVVVYTDGNDIGIEYDSGKSEKVSKKEFDYKVKMGAWNQWKQPKLESKKPRKATRKSTKKTSLRERLEQIKESKKTQKVSRKSPKKLTLRERFELKNKKK